MDSWAWPIISALGLKYRLRVPAVRQWLERPGACVFLVEHGGFGFGCMVVGLLGLSRL
jgi:hypothetical protein